MSTVESKKDDGKNIITETEFTARWALIEGYHQLGKRILEDYDNFERAQIYGEKIASRVSLSLGKSERTIERAIQFARLYNSITLKLRVEIRDIFTTN